MLKKQTKTENSSKEIHTAITLKKIIRDIHYPTKTQARQAFLLVLISIILISSYLYLIDTGMTKLIELAVKHF